MVNVQRPRTRSGGREVGEPWRGWRNKQTRRGRRYRGSACGESIQESDRGRDGAAGRRGAAPVNAKLATEEYTGVNTREDIEPHEGHL